MPKRVDHQARRTQIADALLRLAASEGLEAVSLRQVAAEAGASAGMVQHYFRTKAEMMAFAMEVVRDRVRTRMDTVEWADTTPKGIVRALLIQLLPLDAERALETHAALAFFAYAAVKPEIGAGLRTDAAQLRAFLAERIRAGRIDEVDPERAAVALLALVDGLGIHLVSQHYLVEDAMAALDTQLDQIFGSTGPADDESAELHSRG